jgi:ribosome-associated protein
MNILELDLSTEFSFKTSRSGGKGGQHVNKTETKVTLIFNVSNSALLTDQQKARIILKLENRINQEGSIQLSNSDTRSQLRNKELVIENFYYLMKKALFVQKKRKPSKPTKASVAKRIQKKKKQSEKKNLRKKDF